MSSLSGIFRLIIGLPGYIWEKVVWLKGEVLGIFDEKIEYYFDEWFPDIFDQITNIHGWITNQIIESGSDIIGKVGKWSDLRPNYFDIWLPDIFDQVTNVHTWLQPELLEIKGKLNFDFEGLGTGIVDRIKELIPDVQDIVETALKPITDQDETLRSVFHASFGGVENVLGGALNSIPEGFKQIIRELAGEFKEILGNDFNGFLDVIKNFGSIPDLSENNDLSNKIVDIFNRFEDFTELTAGDNIPHASMVDPAIAAEKAHDIRKKVLAAKIGLHSIGFIIEIFSIGQIDGFFQIVKDVMDAGGWTRVASEVPMIEHEAKILKPFRYHVNEIYTPEIPGMSDLVRFRVREAITQNELEKWAKMQGFASRFSTAYWDAHWDLPSPSAGYEMEARGIISIERLEFLLEVADYHPEWRDQMLAIRHNLPTRVDLRRMYEAGHIDFNEMVQRMEHTGYSPSDALLVAEAQAWEVQRSNVSLLLTNIKNDYKAGWLTDTDLDKALTDLKLPENFKEYHKADTMADRSRAELNELKSSLINAYRKDLINDSELTDYLTNIGLVEWKVNAIVSQELIKKGEWPFE